MAGAVQWSSRFGFLMASVGFAVGLGNIWRFPYVTGENGGGAFVVVYLTCVVLIGIPIIMAELMIGRRGRLSPPGSMAAVAETEQRSRHWSWVGNLNLLTALFIVVTYAVVAGWVLRYFAVALAGGFDSADLALAQADFTQLRADTRTLLAWTLASLLVTGAILYAGVQGGIEKTVRILMPLLFLLLVGLAVYNVFAGGFSQALAYLFTPDFGRIDGSVLLAAVGQAFFSIGVAMAGMMTFGAYLDRSVSIGSSAVLIALVDTLVAVVAGLVIFPLVFRFGFDPASGTGLIFQTLPVAFAQMPAGLVVAPLFFLLLSVAAVTSMVGLLEPLVAWTIYRLKLERSVGVVLVFSIVWMLSCISVLGHNLWSHWRLFGLGLNDAIDFLANQIMLPLGGILIAVFAGWAMRAATSRRELRLRAGWTFTLWLWLIRLAVPLAVLAILISGLSASFT
ncbi:MAG: sodium-dependent transporter [Pseudomonadales bacterium]